METQSTVVVSDPTISPQTVISEVQQDNSSSEKTKFCTGYRRGICPLTPQECKFAHGAKDLKYTKVDMSQIQKPVPKEKPPTDPSASKGSKAEPKEEEEEEADIMFERPIEKIENYILIYKYQEECFAKGLITERFTLEQLNTDINCLREIRKMYRANIAQEYFGFLCEVYETKYLPRWFVKFCFEQIGWETRWVYLYRNNFSTERKVKNHEYIIKLPQGSEYDSLMRSCIIKIVKDCNLLASLPINPSIIRIAFFKDLMSKDPFMPEITFFLKINNYARLDDYLKVLEKDEDFMRQLCTECGKSYDDIKSQPIFDEESPAYLEFKKKIEETLLDMIKKSSFGFVLYSDFKTKVFQTFKKQIHEFSKSDTQVERLLYDFAFRNRILILNLLSDTYLFSLKKLQDTKIVNFIKEVPKALQQSCFESNEVVHSGHSHFSFHHNINADDTHIYDKIDDQILEKELDINKVLLVDSFDTLATAKEIFKSVKDVAIDLEGSLSKGGTIELLQCGCPDKIVIFDLYGINSKASKAQNPDSEDVALSKEVNSFIKSFMEDPKICKVFHDCRRDTLALHLFTNSCPTNVIDVSALYMLIEQLKKYQQFAAVIGLTKHKVSEEEVKSEGDRLTVLNDQSISAIIEEIGRYWPPGLNDVLTKYEATHGPNGLKLIFKERFDKMNKDYFFKRPVDKEFLIYSARDVEDLVEVKERMVKTVFEILNSLGISNIDEEKVMYVCLAASKTYSIFGCDHRRD